MVMEILLEEVIAKLNIDRCLKVFLDVEEGVEEKYSTASTKTQRYETAWCVQGNRSRWDWLEGEVQGEERLGAEWSRYKVELTCPA